jgi:hypothetical protein
LTHADDLIDFLWREPEAARHQLNEFDRRRPAHLIPSAWFVANPQGNRSVFFHGQMQGETQFSQHSSAVESFSAASWRPDRTSCLKSGERLRAQPTSVILRSLRLSFAEGCMALRLASLLFACGVALTLFLSPASAGCSSRPGTPTNVTARATWPGAILVEWTDTADETVWWDYDVTELRRSCSFINGQRHCRWRGVNIPQRAGQPPRADGLKGWRLQNTFLPGSGVSQCYRIRARTGPGAEGCVSEIFSNTACATAS